MPFGSPPACDNPCVSDDDGFRASVCLVAIAEPLDTAAQAELRDYYKANETPVLDRLLKRGDSLRIGVMSLWPDLDSSATGRVHTLLGIRGTTPRYVLPAVTPELAMEILAAFEPQPSDDHLETVKTDALREFLDRNLGGSLATTSAPI